MKPTLLLPLLLVLSLAYQASAGSCTEGCLSCNSQTSMCLECQDDLELVDGYCIEPYVYKDMIYVKDNDHFLLVDIDNDGVDIAVIVIGSIIAAVLFIGSLYCMNLEGWKELVPEGKEPVKVGEKQPQPSPRDSAKHTPRTDHVVEIGAGNNRMSPMGKEVTSGGSPTPKSPSSVKSRTPHGGEVVHAENVESPSKDNDFDDEEVEPYYPTKKEMESRNRNDQVREEEEEEEDQIEVQIHEGEEDEVKTAQETPSPKKDYTSNPSSKKKSARRGSHHSDVEEEEDEDRPHVHSHSKNNQHRGNEGEDDEEGFESARSGKAHEHEEEQEEEEEHEEEQEEEEEEEQHEDVMDLNDLGFEDKKNHGDDE